MPETKTILSRNTKLAFTAVTVMLPFLAVLLLEGVLRVTGYGPDLSLCTKTTVRGIDYYAANGAVKGRYFSGRFFGGKGFSENVTPEYFVMPKPPGTYRIFCLGGSTTAGYPYGVLGSFSRFLQDRLQKTFPRKSIEVINFGITATNSFTVLDMTRDAIAYEPDLIIVYDGHNEFYGALGLASRESAGQARWLGLAYMRLTRLKTFLLLNDAIDIVRNLFSPAAPEDVSGTAMERLAKGKLVPYGSRLYQSGLEWYKVNMAETKRICEDHNVPIVFSSQVSNLRDLPPFVSEFSEGTTADMRALFTREYAAGAKAMEANDLSGAIAHLRTAVHADSLRADAHYSLARALDAKGDDTAAHAEYTAARDLDQLRFRQSSDFNDAVRALRGKNVFVGDCEKYFENGSPRGLIGNNFILEHLHPTLYGYFMLAKEYAQLLRDNNLIASPERWTKADSLSDDDLWNTRTVSPLDEQIGARRIAILTSSWPFRPQQAPAIPPGFDEPVAKIAAEVVSRSITWEKGAVLAAEFYQSHDSIGQAAACYRELIVHTPFNTSPYLRLAEMLIDRGNSKEGAAVLERSLVVEPSHKAYQLLGRLAYENKNYAESVRWLELSKEHAASIQERTDASMGLALCYFALGRPVEAESEAEYILTFNSGSESTHRFLDYIHSLNK
jgi:Flp pilus assembly protein TadD